MVYVRIDDVFVSFVLLPSVHFLLTDLDLKLSQRVLRILHPNNTNNLTLKPRTLTNGLDNATKKTRTNPQMFRHPCQIHTNIISKLSHILLNNMIIFFSLYILL